MKETEDDAKKQKDTLHSWIRRINVNTAQSDSDLN